MDFQRVNTKYLQPAYEQVQGWYQRLNNHLPDNTAASIVKSGMCSFAASVFFRRKSSVDALTTAGISMTATLVYAAMTPIFQKYFSSHSAGSAVDLLQRGIKVTMAVAGGSLIGAALRRRYDIPLLTVVNVVFQLIAQRFNVDIHNSILFP